MRRYLQLWRECLGLVADQIEPFDRFVAHLTVLAIHAMLLGGLMIIVGAIWLLVQQW